MGRVLKLVSDGEHISRVDSCMGLLERKIVMKMLD
jgi:hypothetical protein